MAFVAEEQLRETIQRLESDSGLGLLPDLSMACEDLRKQLQRDIKDQDIREFFLNIAVYALQVLTDLGAPAHVLTAGLLLDAFLRTKQTNNSLNFHIVRDQTRQLLLHGRALYKFEAQLPWRMSSDISEFEKAVIEHARLRARSNCEIASESIQSIKTQHENHRKLMVALAQESESLIIKLADRIAVLKFLKPGTPIIDHLRIANEGFLLNLATETLNIHVPIAERLGIWKLKWHLQDLAFRIMKPGEYQKIHREISTTRTDREAYINGIIQSLESDLRSMGIPAEVQGRPKSIYSIFQKKAAHNVETRKINDLTGVRIIIDSNAAGLSKQTLQKMRPSQTPEMKKIERKAIKNVKREAEKEDARICYTVLDYLLSTWPALTVDGRGIYDDGKVSRDWIAHPKPNGYQSIHTTILYTPREQSQQASGGNIGRPVEVQIRTVEMHKVAEYGVAAHWLYKEKAKFLPRISRKERAWNLEQMKHIDSNRNLSQEAKTFSGEEVFCLTPKGEILRFPVGATSIDFAYRIHKDVGNRILNSKINNRIASLRQPLKNGDIVEIFTSKKEQGPKGEWLRHDKTFAKTRKAKSMIRRWLRDHKPVSQNK